MLRMIFLDDDESVWCRQVGDALVFLNSFYFCVCVYPAGDSPGGVLAAGEEAEEEDITSLWGSQEKWKLKKKIIGPDLI